MINKDVLLQPDASLLWPCAFDHLKLHVHTREVLMSTLLMSRRKTLNTLDQRRQCLLGGVQIWKGKQHLCRSTAVPCRMSPMHATPHCHDACLLCPGCAAGSCHSAPHLPAQLAGSLQLTIELGGQCVPIHKHSHTRLWLCLKHAWLVLPMPQPIAGHTGACYVIYNAVKLGRTKLTQLFSVL